MCGTPSQRTPRFNVSVAIHAPVVLNVSSPRNVVPQAAVLHGQFVVTFRVAEEEICEVIAGECTVEIERTLRCTEEILHFFVQCPACTNLDLVRPFGPGYVVAELIVIRLIVPRPTGDFEVRAMEPFRSMLGMRLSLLGPLNSRELVASYPAGIERLLKPEPANGTMLMRLPL